MTNQIADLLPRKTARMSGLFYLIFILTTVLAAYVRSNIVVSGDAMATANNIVSSQGLFRVGFVTELVSAVFFILAAWALYVLLKPINKIKPPKSAAKSKLHILQDSGATRNRHEVVSAKETIYRWEKNGKEYLHCDKDYKIRHVGGDCEHGEQLVGAGTREVLHEMEHDPWSNELRIVKD